MTDMRLAAVLLAAAAGAAAGGARSEAPGDCAALAGAAPAGVTITEAAQTAPTPEIPVSHCLLRGRMAERTGADGQAYAIRFELRLPDQWEGRFMHQFNGGNDGEVKAALGDGTGIPRDRPALARGFAVVSSDAGHDGNADPKAGLAAGNLFGFDFEARRDYGYGAVAKLNPVALRLVEAYYGRPPDFTYGFGRSNGGRHAMVAAERMPEAFDGLLAGYPGFNLPRAALQHPWDMQILHGLSATPGEAFSEAELGIVSAAVAAACDALDGLEDGAIFATEACQRAFDPAAMICAEAQTGDCLPEAKVAALQRIFAGPSDSAGRPLYSGWVWDTGIDSANWRFWKLESPIPPWDNKPIIAIMGAGSLAHIFTTPPVRIEGTPAALERYLLEFDFDRDAPKIHATAPGFPESAVEVMTPPNVDAPTLARLEAAGGKLIVYHGTSDPVFSFRDTADWYRRLVMHNPGAETFVRLYAVPGMPHGAGGNAPDEMDMLGALIDWVERGKAPAEVVAAFSYGMEVDEENAGAKRPLCPYPHYAVYREGDPRSAASFACR